MGIENITVADAPITGADATGIFVDPTAADATLNVADAATGDSNVVDATIMVADTIENDDGSNTHGADKLNLADGDTDIVGTAFSKV